MNFKITKEWTKSFFMMIIAVILMGMCVSMLVLSDMGTDPYSAMNYGISAKLGMTFGNYQLISNLVLLVIVVIFERNLIGTGTLGNMILVGYSADFFTWVFKNVFHVPAHLGMGARITFLVPGLIIFVIMAAVYMQSGHGTAPYDAVSFLISDKIKKYTGKDTFRVVRIIYDLVATCIGYAAGGEVGIMTVCMVIMMGTTVDYVGRVFEKHRNKVEEANG